VRLLPFSHVQSAKANGSAGVGFLSVVCTASGTATGAAAADIATGATNAAADVTDVSAGASADCAFNCASSSAIRLRILSSSERISEIAALLGFFAVESVLSGVAAGELAGALSSCGAN